MIRSMKWLIFDSELDLNMGFYHIKLDVDAQKLFTIVFPWNTEKYRYKSLSMGINIVYILMFFKFHL
jgi:hypothetical protein